MTGTSPVSDLLVDISKERTHTEVGGLENLPTGNAPPGCLCKPVLGETYSTNAENIL